MNVSNAQQIILFFSFSLLNMPEPRPMVSSQFGEVGSVSINIFRSRTGMEEAPSVLQV